MITYRSGYKIRQDTALLGTDNHSRLSKIILALEYIFAIGGTTDFLKNLKDGKYDEATASAF